jgi:hypothetical protein
MYWWKDHVGGLSYCGFCCLCLLVFCGFGCYILVLLRMRNNQVMFNKVMEPSTMVPSSHRTYNVYPQVDSEWTVQQEGWTVPLPLECASIFAIPGGGLLLQRVPDESELNAVILEAPPQQRASVFDKSATLSPTMVYHAPMDANMNYGNVPALFTLRHYQEDLTPLAHPNGFWNDPLEKVLWVGKSHLYASSVSGDSKNDSAEHSSGITILLVTHHCRLQRHSVWSLHDAPPPHRNRPPFQCTMQHGTITTPRTTLPPPPPTAPLCHPLFCGTVTII